jgi:hypothetical protein
VIYAIVIAVLLAIGFGSGWQVRAWRADSEQLKEAAAQHEETARRERTVDIAATKHEQFKASLSAREQIITREVERVVKEPVYLTDCFSDDGLRIIAADIAARHAASEPEATMPTASSPAR